MRQPSATCLRSSLDAAAGPRGKETVSLSYDTALANIHPDRSYERAAWLAGAAATALAVLTLDFLSLLHGAIAVLYIAVVLLVAQREPKRSVLLTGLACAALAGVAFIIQHRREPLDSAYVRLGVSLLAIAVTTFLSIRDRDTRSALAEQGRIVELTHDTVVITDDRGIIRYWNDGAERLYGWTRAEAFGKSRDQLLETRADIGAADAALGIHGQWSGEVVRTRRDGTGVVLAARQLTRLGPDGRPIGVIETSQDLTEQREAEQAREDSEKRYQSMFHASGFAAWEIDWSEVRRRLVASLPEGADVAAFLAGHPEIALYVTERAVIRDCNDAAVALFEAAGPEALIGHNIGSLYTAETFAALIRMLDTLWSGAAEVEAETRFATFQGNVVEVVLRVTMAPGREPWSRAIVMALDITERKHIQARLEQTSAELAHAARVSVLGQLAASIAHEVNQPLAAIVNYGKSGHRWLSRDPPDLAEALNCLQRVVANGARAAEIISGVRALARKTAPNIEPLDLGEVVGEAVALIDREARGARASLTWSAHEDAPMVFGDRVQVQQVVVNLLMNGLQAMAESTDGPRELVVSIGHAEAGQVLVSVRDSGSGIAGENPDRIFEPFFTTKADGMGIGLSICRSIIEAQGGRITAANNHDRGATVAFSLPAAAVVGGSGRPLAAEPSMLG